MYFDYFHIQWVFDLVMDLWKMKYILNILNIVGSNPARRMDVCLL